MLLQAAMVAGILLGAVALVLDLGNRLFGCYARTAVRVAWRVAVIVLAVLLLTAPLWVGAVLPGLAAAGRLRGPFAVIGVLAFLHFLFPYRFGIRSRPWHSAERSLTPPIILRERRVAVERPEAAGARLTCLVFSDLHCNGQRRLAAIRDGCRALAGTEADCVLVLGDFGERTELLAEAIRALASVPSRFGTFCVRGNHDFERGRAGLLAGLLERNGIRLLSNEVCFLPDGSAALVGLEPPWGSDGCEAVPEGALVIGVAHAPDSIRQMERLGADVVIAGHTHGGRVRLPGLGPLLVPSRYGRFLHQGFFQRGRTILCVAPGLGYHAPFFRRGEVMRLTVEASARCDGAIGGKERR